MSIKHSLFIALMTGKVPEIGKGTGLLIEKKSSHAAVLSEHIPATLAFS